MENANLAAVPAPYYLAATDTGVETVPGMGNDWDVWFVNNSGRDVARLRLTSNGSLDWAGAAGENAVTGGPRVDEPVPAGGVLRIDCVDWDCFFDYGIRYDLDADGFRWAPSLKCIMCDDARYPDTLVPHLGRMGKIVRP